MFGIHDNLGSCKSAASNPARLETLEGRRLMSAGPWGAHAAPYEGSQISPQVNMSITPVRRTVRLAHVMQSQLREASPSETLNATPALASKAILRSFGGRRFHVITESLD